MIVCMGSPVGVDPERVRRLYDDDNLGQKKIAQILGVNRRTVWYHLDRLNASGKLVREFPLVKAHRRKREQPSDPI